MSISRTSLKGVTFYDSIRAYNGVTLLIPKLGKRVWLIDMVGRFVNHWDMPYEPSCDAQLLPNANLLYMGKVPNDPLVDLKGAGGILLEFDWNNKLIWQYKDPYLHHTFCRMKNGNTMVIKWVKVPNRIAAKVKGGISGTERDGVMWGDALQEITPSGEVVWEWIAHEHLDPQLDSICPMCPRSEWTHTNACAVHEDGNVLTSFMKINTIAIIDKKTGDIKWRWGSDELAHQHAPTILDNGNILVFDNGLHERGFPMGFSRVLEIDPRTNEMIWAYECGKAGMQFSFHSSTMGNCQRLPNGNTLICEATTGRILEVNYNQELIWEFINDLPEPSPIKTKSCMVCSAYRYGPDYPGLKGAVVREEGETTYSARGEESVHSRLDFLGY